MDMRTNVTLQNEEHDVLSNKYIQRKPAPAPKIKVSFKVDIRAYKSHSPPLAVKLELEYVKMLTKSTIITLLGVIPKMFPMIGEFGGVEQQGDGSDRLEINSKLNVKYIAADPVAETETIHDIDAKGQPSATHMVDGH